jgi:hypothetical protein
MLTSFYGWPPTPAAFVTPTLAGETWCALRFLGGGGNFGGKAAAFGTWRAAAGAARKLLCAVAGPVYFWGCQPTY